VTDTERRLFESAYWPTDEHGRNLLSRLGFTPKTQTQGDGRDFWWFPAIAVYLAFDPNRPPLLSTEQELVMLRAIASDPDFESALAAVWLSECRNSTARYRAAIEYVRTSLPQLFGTGDPA
jgi:hypothetical protein